MADPDDLQLFPAEVPLQKALQVGDVCSCDICVSPRLSSEAVRGVGAEMNDWIHQHPFICHPDEAKEL